MALAGLISSSAFAANSSALSLGATATSVGAGQSVSYTVTDPSATSSTEYQFWIQTPSGQWKVAQNYSTKNTFVWSSPAAGSYTVVAYALAQNLVSQRDWAAASPTNPEPLYVNSAIHVNVVSNNNPSNPLATVTVTVQNVAQPQYQLWWKTPSGVWEQSGDYQSGNVFTVALSEAGTYQFVAYAKSPDAPASPSTTIYTPEQTVAITEPAAQVVLTPAVSALKAGSQGVDPIYVSIQDAQGHRIMNFNGTVTLTDSAGLLVGANGTANTVSVDVQNGQGMAEVMAGATAGTTDTVSSSALVPSSGSEVSSEITYGTTWVASRSFSGNISQLHTISTIASTQDATNGDANPYGLTYDNPAKGPANNPFQGDFLVSNFSNQAGVNGAGTTIEAINPKTGAVTRFAATANGPVSLAVSPLGPLWIANFGTNGTNGNDQVLTPFGGQFPNGGSIITSSYLDGPWGQVFAPSANGPAFLVTNALNGSIDAMYGFSPPNFNTDTKFAVIGQGLAHNGTTASTVQGPQGMVYDSNTHMVYVTDTADNSIRAFYWNGPGTPNQGQGQLIYQGAPLNSPVGITVDPLNGDLLVVNQGNNNLVEIALNNGKAYAAGQTVLDSTPVNPTTGAGSALFGVYAMANQGQLEVFFTDDNTNTLDVLK